MPKFVIYVYDNELYIDEVIAHNNYTNNLRDYVIYSCKSCAINRDHKRDEVTIIKDKIIKTFGKNKIFLITNLDITLEELKKKIYTVGYNVSEIINSGLKEILLDIETSLKESDD